MLKAVIFDLDDTLLDWAQRSGDWQTFEREHLGKVVQFLERAGHSVGEPEAFFSRVSQLSRDSWMDTSRGLRAPRYMDALTQSLREINAPELFNAESAMREAGWRLMDGVTPFPDVLEVLPLLKSHGIKIGLITNASTPMWLRDHELRDAGLLEYFSDARLTAADAGFLKPHRAPFERALEMLNATADEAVMVGDSLEADIVGAKGMGMIGVLRLIEREGVSPAHSVFVNGQEIRPDAMIYNLHELLPVLDQKFPEWRTQYAVSNGDALSNGISNTASSSAHPDSTHDTPTLLDHQQDQQA